MATMSTADFGVVMPRTDLVRPWCQAAAPAVQFRSPVQPCGQRFGLHRVIRYGVLYNVCDRHMRRHGYEEVA